MRIAVTGASGLIGRGLVAALVADPAVDEVVALDVVRPAVPAGGVGRTVDVRDPAIAAELVGCDVLVHLAFRLDPLDDDTDVRDVNLTGTSTTLRAAVDAGVRRLVVASSAAVYGAHRDNDVPLTESSPLRPESTFPYARMKGEVEDWLWGWAAELPDDVVLSVLRPAVVAGPGVDNFVSRQLELPRFISVVGHRPPVQVVHVDDVVDAFRFAATRDLPGAWNVAAPGWLSQDEALAVLGRRRLELPEEITWTLADLLWRAGLGPAPAGMLAYLLHPWVVDVRRLAAAGWTASRSNRDALAALAAEHAGWLRIGPVRVRRATLRIAVGTLAAGAALALAARVRRAVRG